MVDRIDKLKSNEAWKIQEATPSKKDKRNQSDEEKQQNARSSFEEKPDWDRLIAKENPGAGNLLTRDLKKISFKQSGFSQDDEATDLHEVEIEQGQSQLHSSSKSKGEMALLVFTVVLLVVLLYLIWRLFV